MSDDDEPLPRFSKEYNWCDRNCDRCPIAERCDLVRREQQLRWQDQARGLDPDAPERAWEHVASELERAVKMAEQTAREEGIDLEAPLPAPVVNLLVERMERAALRIGVAMKIEDGDDEAMIDALHPALLLTMKVAGKIVRVGGYLSEDCEVFPFDGEPNLLLLEHVDRELRRELERVRDDPNAAGMPPVKPVQSAQAHALAFARNSERHARVQQRATAALEALDALDVLIAPLLARITPEARDELAARVAAGDAPSPFLVREPPAATLEDGASA